MILLIGLPGLRYRFELARSPLPLRLCFLRDKKIYTRKEGKYCSVWRITEHAVFGFCSAVYSKYSRADSGGRQRSYICSLTGSAPYLTRNTVG